VIYCGDSLELMKTLETGSVDAVIADPPYNIGKASWDKIPDYLEWCREWITEAARVMKRQGAFWCFHSDPLVLADIAKIIEGEGKPQLNWVTWDKYNEQGTHSMKGFLDGYTVIGGLRRLQDFSEYITYHADDGQWGKQNDDTRGFIFEPLRAYLDGERKRAGVDKIACNVACGFSASAGGMASRHYFSRSQWQLPTPEHYAALRTLFNANGGEYLRREYEDLRREYEDLRREYEDLRREYEDLRPTFNNPGKVSSVWQFPPAKPNGHPTPKPVELIRRIVETTTNPGDVILDPFAGSGTTGEACIKTRREFILIEKDPKYVAMAERRIRATQPPLMMAL